MDDVPDQDSANIMEQKIKLFCLPEHANGRRDCQWEWRVKSQWEGVTEHTMSSNCFFEYDIERQAAPMKSRQYGPPSLKYKKTAVSSEVFLIF